jgi:hypothetical protein
MRPAAWKEQPIFSPEQATALLSSKQHARLALRRIEVALRVLDEPDPAPPEPGEADDLNVIHTALLRARECLDVAIEDADKARFTP